MPETNAERLERIEEEKELIIDGITDKLLGVELTLSDYAFLHAEAERAQKLSEREDAKILLVNNGLEEDRYVLQDENERLRENLKEMTVQENAMQAHYNLAFKNMQMYKKCCDEITAAMNTERPAEEKTRDIRQILDSIK